MFDVVLLDAISDGRCILRCLRVFGWFRWSGDQSTVIILLPFIFGVGVDDDNTITRRTKQISVEIPIDLAGKFLFPRGVKLFFKLFHDKL
jgi:hypothetical protein